MVAPNPKTQRGFLVLADISGYTSYLAAVELDHANEILSELLETIVASFRPVLSLSKLEGDAVFAYAPAERLPRGETLLELFEITYAAFRDRVGAVNRRTTCECQACRAIPSLDLKFLTHYGSFIVQTVSGIHELVGSDVNLLHRLLKNQVAEATGWRGYALFTEASLARLGVTPEAMHAHTETYDHLGEVKTYSLNLRPRYQQMAEARRVFVTPEEAHGTFTLELAAPPATTWTWLNDPQKRLEWEQLATRVIVRPGGRMAPGARSHCVHGKNTVMIETILDWRPFEYYTLEKQHASLPIAFIVTYQLEPMAEGHRTRLRVRARLRARLPARLLGPACRAAMKLLSVEKLHGQLVHMVAAQAEATAPPDRLRLQAAADGG